MTQLEELKSKIQKAVPEIMKLARGCDFVWIDENYNESIFKIINIIRIDDIVRGETFEIQAVEKDEVVKTLYSFDGYDEEYGRFTDCAKILGRPITLEDVLIILVKQSCEDKLNKDLPIELHFGVKAILNKWRFGKSLDDQSQETIEWLNSKIK